MNFEDQLKQMIREVEGAKAAVLMGFDGIAVSEVKPDPALFPLQEVIIEYSQLLTESIKIAQGNNLGGIDEFMLSSDRYSLILRVLDQSYFAGLFLDSNGNFGKGRFVLRRAAPALKAEL